jgi:hypothetical protein
VLEVRVEEPKAEISPAVREQVHDQEGKVVERIDPA